MAGKYRGVTRRGNAWQISFTYKGERCREQLRFPGTRKGEDAANNFRGRVLMEIDMGTFDYAKHFPE
ncbi:MAG: DUF3596 domain-containing protein, partial [Pseudomonadales bacterium]|nr:DUF3596 domain-containing protein [Pseudomonadales bacterium]